MLSCCLVERRLWTRTEGRLCACRKTVPFLMQAVRQGFQDLGARSIPAAHAALAGGVMRVEARSTAAQAEGGIHDMHSFNKVRW